jgi:hypothetical protein
MDLSGPGIDVKLKEKKEKKRCSVAIWRLFAKKKMSGFSTLPGILERTSMFS